MESIATICTSIAPLDEEAMRAARMRSDQLTKPRGSLGRLEELAVQLAGIRGDVRPRFPRKAIVVLAGDHGVTAEGVSAYPQSVTAQMVLNFLHDGAAINVLARRVGARIVVADLGVAADLPSHPLLVEHKIAPGTQNMAVGPAMTRSQAMASINAGLEIVNAQIARGMDLIGTGEMGIGNTTATSAIVAAVTGRPVAEVTGRGTGVDDAVLQRKVAVIERALQVNRPDPNDPIDILTKVGGFEIGGLIGVVLGAAAKRIPIVVDGFISTGAALLAVMVCPQARAYIIPAHRSVEAGHTVLLEQMDLHPLLNLDLRLGEGSGSALAMHLIEDAVAIQDEMATFDEAGVSDRDEEGGPGPGG